MKLLKIDIQDGENTYNEYVKVKDTKEANWTADNYVDGCLRAVKDKLIMDITEKELKVLEKFGIV